MSVKHGSWKWQHRQNFKLIMSASTMADVTFDDPNPSKPSLFISTETAFISPEFSVQKKKKKCQKWNNPRNRTFNIRIHENRGQSKSTFSVSVFLKVLPPSVLDSIIPPNPLSHSHSQLRTARDPWSIHSHSDAVSPQAGTSLSLSLSLHFKQRS